METEKFGYVDSQGNEIAYMAIGGARHDLLLVPGGFGSFDVLLDEPARGRFFAPLAEFARIITFDQRGMGMSSFTGTPPDPGDISVAYTGLRSSYATSVPFVMRT